MSALRISLIFCCFLLRADWPMYRMDAGRSGYTEVSLAESITRRWQYQPRQKPEPAWPLQANLDFDRGPALVVAGGRLLIPSSATGTLIALDSETGRQLWRFHSEGPLRFAPAVAAGRVHLASDDGHLYTLALNDGKLLWKARLGPSGAMVLGNGRMISRWPARSGPVVRAGIVYAGAGVWPSEGFFLHAFNAATGDTVWSSTETGQMRMPQPHGGTDAASGVAGQGYLALAGERLFVPTGRAVPAAFNSQTGEYNYFHLQRYGSRPHYLGGSDIVALDHAFFNSGVAFAPDTGIVLGELGTRQLARHNEGLLAIANGTLTRYNWGPVTTRNAKHEPLRQTGVLEDWTLPVEASGPIIATATQAIIAADSAILVIDLETQVISQRLPVMDPVFDLAISGGQLYASTETGKVYCFGEGPAIANSVTPSSALPRAVIAEARALLENGPRAGFAVDFACGDGQLACALALESNLIVLAKARSAESAAQARSLAASLGLLGTRVSIFAGKPEFLPRFASLLFASEQLASGHPPGFLEQAAEFARPGTGLSLWRSDTWHAQLRPAAKATGKWTHQYATPGNTVCSGETALDGPLGLQWFGDLPAVLPQRGFAPLVADGHMVVAAFDKVLCTDAYTGRVLWQRDFPGLLDSYKGSHWASAITATRICMDSKSVFVHDDHECFELSLDSGAIRRRWQPPSPGPWGFLSLADDVLIGGIAIPSHTSERVFPNSAMKKVLSESSTLFAIDRTTGKQLWRYDAAHAIRHNAIAAGRGRLYFIDRPLAAFDTGRAVPWKHPHGELVCVDLRSGEERWRCKDHIFGTSLAYAAEHETLVMSYHKWRWSPNSERGGQISAFHAVSGEPKWQIQADYRSRLVIVDARIYADGGSWDLGSGEAQPFAFERSYGCGQISASASQLYFRSATLGYIDLARPEKVMNFGGMRPSCWINAIPASGLLLVPESTPRCRCSYINKTWFALAPATKD
jgi:outer membrane protein assembly factor BamB